MQGHAEFTADGVQARHALEYGSRRIGVVEFAVPGQHARVERAADHDGVAAFHAGVQQRRQRSLLQQGIAAGQQGAIEVEFRHRAQHDLALVDAEAYGFHLAAGSQFIEGAKTAASRQLAPVLLIVFAMRGLANIVHEQDIDALEPQPLQAVLVRTQHAVIRVVVMGTERQRRGKAVVAGAHGGVGPHQPSHLGADHKFMAGPFAQRRAETALGLGIAIERRRVEEAHAGIPRAIERDARLRVADGLVQAAYRRAAHADAGQRQAPARQGTQLCDIHGLGPQAARSGKQPGPTASNCL
ncbi:hypothetical protein D3C81_1073490 [compost metagenome]